MLKNEYNFLTSSFPPRLRETSFKRELDKMSKERENKEFLLCAPPPPKAENAEQLYIALLVFLSNRIDYRSCLIMQHFFRLTVQIVLISFLIVMAGQILLIFIRYS